MRSFIVTIALTVGWMLIMPSLDAQAQPSTRDAVAAELAAGTLGGAIVGVSSAYLATAICAAGPEALLVVSFLGLTPFASSAGATWGFNVGAELTTDE